MHRILRPCLCVVFAVWLLTGCQSVPVQTGGTTVAVTKTPPPIATQGATHYRVDTQRSELRILVYRAGPLARLGHNHVIAATQISGDIYVQSPLSASGFVLQVPLDGLRVDPPALRREEGPDFESQPSEQAVAGTREHMLGPDCLDAERYPEIRIRSVSITGPDWQPDVTLQITLHGATRELTVPVAFDRSADTVRVVGGFSLRQSEFGITPYSVLGGGLRVQDTLRLRFRIVAQAP